MERGAAHVVVDGPGPLAAECTVQLRRCGVAVRAGALAADAAEAAHGVGESQPGLVVLVPGGRVPVWAGAPWLHRRVAHLPVEVLARTTVGPLVVPGRSPCLACVARARGGSGAGTLAGSTDDRAVLVLAAALVTVTTLGVLRGDEDLAGISTEIGPRASTTTHRLWHADASCGCASATMTA
jgi:hypothetical protein